MLLFQQAPHPFEHAPELLTLTALEGHLPTDTLDFQIGLQIAYLPRVDNHLPLGAHELEIAVAVDLANRLFQQCI